MGNYLGKTSQCVLTVHCCVQLRVRSLKENVFDKVNFKTIFEVSPLVIQMIPVCGLWNINIEEWNIFCRPDWVSERGDSFLPSPLLIPLRVDKGYSGAPRRLSFCRWRVRRFRLKNVFASSEMKRNGIRFASFSSAQAKLTDLFSCIFSLLFASNCSFCWLPLAVSIYAWTEPKQTLIIKLYFDVKILEKFTDLANMDVSLDSEWCVNRRRSCRLIIRGTHATRALLGRENWPPEKADENILKLISTPFYREKSYDPL